MVTNLAVLVAGSVQAVIDARWYYNDQVCRSDLPVTDRAFTAALRRAEHHRL